MKRLHKVSGPIVDELRQAIKESCYTLKDINRGCGVSDTILSRFMRSERSPSLNAASLVCDFLGLRLCRKAGEKKPAKRVSLPSN